MDRLENVVIGASHIDMAPTAMASGGPRFRPAQSSRDAGSKVPADVEQLEALEEGLEQLLSGGVLILALGLDLLGVRRPDHADNFHVGLLPGAAICRSSRGAGRVPVRRMLRRRGSSLVPLLLKFQSAHLVATPSKYSGPKGATTASILSGARYPRRTLATCLLVGILT
jgi:hypothetical protein